MSSLGGEFQRNGQIDPSIVAEVQILKELTWTYVIDSNSLVAQRYGQRRLIESLYRTFYEASLSKSDRGILPQLYRDDVERVGGDIRKTKRIVADLIASMSEAQAIAE